MTLTRRACDYESTNLTRAYHCLAVDRKTSFKDEDTENVEVMWLFRDIHIKLKKDR